MISKTLSYRLFVSKPSLVGDRYYPLTLEGLMDFLETMKASGVADTTPIRCSSDPDDDESWGQLRAVEVVVTEHDGSKEVI